MISKKIVYCIFLSFVPFFITLISNNEWIHLFFLFSSFIFILYIQKTIIINPIVWLLGGIVLYYGLFLVAGDKLYNQIWTFQYPIISMLIFGITGTVLSFGSSFHYNIFNLSFYRIKSKESDKILLFIAKSIYLVSFFIIFISSILILKSGIVLKGEFTQSGLFTPDVFFNWANITFIIILLKTKNLYRIKWIILIQFFIFILALGVLGERSPIFSLIISILLIFRPGKIYNPIYIGLFICLLPVLVSLSNFARSTIVSSSIVYTQKDNSFLEFIAKDEFISAGRNLSVVLNNPVEEEIGFDVLKSDLAIGFLPSFLISDQVNGKNHYRFKYFGHLVEKGQGVGFSFHGEGWMLFGLIGLIIWTLIFSFVALIFYKSLFSVKKEPLYLSLVYVFVVPTIIYCLRADFSSFIALIFKQIFIPVLFIWFLVKVYQEISIKV